MDEKTYLLKVTTDGQCERIEFDKEHDYEQLQDAVDGWIERVPQSFNGADLFINELGKLKRLPFNEVLTKMWADRERVVLDDTIVGNGVFAKTGPDGETLGLTEDECEVLEEEISFMRP